jgi:hypothetical protein
MDYIILCIVGIMLATCNIMDKVVSYRWRIGRKVYTGQKLGRYGIGVAGGDLLICRWKRGYYATCDIALVVTRRDFCIASAIFIGMALLGALGGYLHTQYV